MKFTLLASVICASASFVQASPIPNPLNTVSSSVAFSSVNTANLVNGAVTNPKLAPNAVAGAGGGINYADNIVAQSITNTEVKDNTLMGGKLASNAGIVGGQIASNTITTGNIQDNTIVAGDINPGAGIVGSQLSATANIVGSQLAGNAGIVGGQILDGTVSTSDIQDKTIVAGDINPDAGIVGSQLSATANIVGSQLAGNAGIVGGQILDGTVTSGNIKDSTIVAGDISSSAGILGSQLDSSAGIVGSQLATDAGIVGSQIASNTVTSDNIVDGTIEEADLGYESVTADEIRDETITRTDISPNANIVGSQLDGHAGITGSQIADETITTANIVPGSITFNRLSSTAVMGSGTGQTSNVAPGSIGNHDITDHSVTVAKMNFDSVQLPGNDIATNTVSGSGGTLPYNNIEAGSLTGTEIKDGSITNTEIADHTLTHDKFVAGYGFEVIVPSQSFNGDAIVSHTITNDELETVSYYGIYSSSSEEINPGFASSPEVSASGTTISFPTFGSTLPVVQITPFGDYSCWFASYEPSSVDVSCSVSPYSFAFTVTGPAHSS